MELVKGEISCTESGRRGLFRCELNAGVCSEGATGGSIDSPGFEATGTAVFQSSYSGAIPTVRYVHSGERALLYNNNPEQVTKSDLADRAGVSIYAESLKPGKYRNFFEHVNRTGNSIGYGSQIYNPGPGSLSVTISGRGFEASMSGGSPFRQLLGNSTSGGGTFSLKPGETLYVLRKDASIPDASFFSGVVDFELRGGNALFRNVAYVNPSSISGSPAYQGYIRRREPDGTDESMMYKGFNAHTEVVASHVALANIPTWATGGSSTRSQGPLPTKAPGPGPWA